MKTSDIHRHCPEVENLMEGNMPFVTRYGITLVILVIFTVLIILFFSEGTSHQLINEMIEHIIEQITSKI